MVCQNRTMAQTPALRIRGKPASSLFNLFLVRLLLRAEVVADVGGEPVVLLRDVATVDRVLDDPVPHVVVERVDT